MGSKGREENGSVCRNLSSVVSINMDDVPELILLEVLLRLPVKVLFRFKIVSKQWLSIISDPYFARMYVSRTSLSSHSQNWTLIHSFVDNPTIPTAKHLPVIKVSQHECSLGTNCLQQRLILPSASKNRNLDYRIVGVSNGLVLYDVHHRRRRVYGFYICNLITGQWIALPPHKHGFILATIGFVTQVEDNVLVSYRVVLLDPSRSGSVNKFSVYFSEISKWEDIDIDFDEEIYFYYGKKSAVLDKILHQMINGHRIMAYDPYNKPEYARLISLPGVPLDAYHGRNNVDIGDGLLDQHQGHLIFFAAELHGLREELSIWVLNDYECGKWCLQHRISIGDIQDGVSSRYFPPPVSFHPCNPNIVYMMDKWGLYSYDSETRKLKTEVDYTNGFPLRFPSHSYVLLVIPPWPVYINLHLCGH